jgi:hypothetical protein
VRPFLVVHPEPVSADLAHLLEILEHVGIEHFVTIGLVVALDVSVLVGFAGLNVPRLNAVSLAPVEQLLSDELRSVIHA